MVCLIKLLLFSKPRWENDQPALGETLCPSISSLRSWCSWSQSCCQQRDCQQK